MMSSSRKQHDWAQAERLERVLNAPTAVCSDSEVMAMAQVASLLAPSVQPREAWRSALKERLLRGGAGPVQSGAGSRDGDGVEGVHTAEVGTGSLGLVVLADVEHIDADRADAVLRGLLGVLDAHSTGQAL